jgi:hypothetical protein
MVVKVSFVSFNFLMLIIYFFRKYDEDKWYQKCLFIAHLLFVSLSIMLKLDTISLIFNTIFFLGFTTTISLLLILAIIYYSEITDKSLYGKKLIEIGKYCEGIFLHLFEVCHKFFTDNYNNILTFIYMCINLFKYINEVLGNNQYSHNIYKKLNEGKEYGSSQATSYANKKFQEYMMSSMLQQFNNNVNEEDIIPKFKPKFDPIDDLDDLIEPSLNEDELNKIIESSLPKDENNDIDMLLVSIDNELKKPDVKKTKKTKSMLINKFKII